MFKEARIKLTAWYLLIIMVISVSFTMAMYRELTSELDRVERIHRLRVEGGLPERLRTLPPPGFEEGLPRSLSLDPNLITETKNRLKIILTVINLAILGVSALAGYFWAGKTLKPIELTIEEQKRFIADASHELRTPLTALKTSMEVALRDKKMSLPYAKKVIKSNLEDIDDLQSLSNNLLSLANLQDNSHNLFFEAVDIAEIVKNAFRKITPLAKNKGIDFKINVKKQLIFANKELLEEMVLIFLDNAVKYNSKNGKVTVKTKKVKDYLFLEIKDSGIGIAKKDIPHIFNRFYRADQSRCKKNVPGFGLGLSLAKKIIEIHQGSVKVVSALGKGTAFTIKLPLKHC